MRIKEISPEVLTTNRYNLMRKGFLNRKEVMEFVPCGARRADLIIDSIRKDVKLEGLENLDNKTVLARRVIAYVGLTEKKISEAYEALKKAPSPTTEKSAQ